VSQKLHFGAINYNKRISSIALSTIATDNTSRNAKLQIRNYRKKMDDGREEILDYDVHILRTFVKRVNYLKVAEFQYILSADLDNAIQSPFNLTHISIKYNITGAIR
jgi:hypothetical protein